MGTCGYLNRHSMFIPTYTYQKTSLNVNEETEKFIHRKVGDIFTDSAQKNLEDLTMVDKEQMWWWKNTVGASNVWYYRDRISTPRGPCTLSVLRESWTKGIIDNKALIWGNGLIDWLPIRNV